MAGKNHRRGAMPRPGPRNAKVALVTQQEGDGLDQAFWHGLSTTMPKLIFFSNDRYTCGFAASAPRGILFGGMGKTAEAAMHVRVPAMRLHKKMTP